MSAIDLGEPAVDDHFERSALAMDRHDAGAQRRKQRRMSGEHAEVALEPGDIDLIDFAGEEKPLGRNEIEVEGGHVR
jgi:hypothetical protein